MKALNDTIICIIGRTCSGKSTFLESTKRQNKYKLNYPLSYTTRPIRKGEENGIGYNFCSDKYFKNQDKLGNIIIKTAYNVNGDTWYYGFNKEDILNSNLNTIIVNPNGLYEILRNKYFKNVVILYLRQDENVLVNRYYWRETGVDMSVIRERCQARIKKDNEDFKPLISNLINIVEHSDLNVKYFELNGYTEDNGEALIECLDKVCNETN